MCPQNTYNPKQFILPQFWSFLIDLLRTSPSTALTEKQVSISLDLSFPHSILVYCFEDECWTKGRGSQYLILVSTESQCLLKTEVNTNYFGKNSYAFPLNELCTHGCCLVQSDSSKIFWGEIVIDDSFRTSFPSDDRFEGILSYNRIKFICNKTLIWWLEQQKCIFFFSYKWSLEASSLRQAGIVLRDSCSSYTEHMTSTSLPKIAAGAPVSRTKKGKKRQNVHSSYLLGRFYGSHYRLHILL